MRMLELSCIALILSCGGRERQSATGEGVSADVSDDSEPTPESSIASASGAAGRSAAVEACVERYPAALPFDAGWPPSDGATPDQPGAPPRVRTPDDVVAQCTAQMGTNCDVTSFISKEAARCAAQATAPDPLLNPEVGFATPWLGFNAASGRVEWSVPAAICCGDGWLFNVDADSGASALVSHTEPMTDCIASCAGVPIDRGAGSR
jgi:hypothetical protein